MDGNSLLCTLAVTLAISGCAGSVQRPHIYSPEETRSGGIGVSTIPGGSTGEISYCDAGMASQVKARREQVYAAGGQARTNVEGIETICPGLAGRKIVFQCTGPKPRPSGLRRDQWQERGHIEIVSKEPVSLLKLPDATSCEPSVLADFEAALAKS